MDTPCQPLRLQRYLLGLFSRLLPELPDRTRLARRPLLLLLLQDGQVLLVVVYETLRDRDDVANQAIEEAEVHALADAYPQDFRLVLARRERVVRYDPLPRPQEEGDGLLLDVRELPLELIREPEGHNGKTGHVVGRTLAVLAHNCRLGICQRAAYGRVRAVDIREARIPLRSFEALG